MTLLPLAAAVVPTLILLWFFVRFDRFPEPPRYILATFLLGWLVAPAAGLVGWFLMQLSGLPEGAVGYGLTRGFLGAALPEELWKFAVLYLFCIRQRHFDEPMDGVVYGATASLGFACLENILYVAFDPDWSRVAIARSLTSVPGHAALGAIMGYFVARAQFLHPRQRTRNLLLALAIPITLHGLYNAPLHALAAAKRLEFGGLAHPEILLVQITLFVLFIAVVLALLFAVTLRRHQTRPVGQDSDE